MFTKKSKVGVTLHQEDGYYYLLNIVAVGPEVVVGLLEAMAPLVDMEEEGVDLFCIKPSRCWVEEGTTSLS